MIPVEMVPTITARFSHAAVVHENAMFIFGGGSANSTTFNDLWKFDLSRRQWVRPLAVGTYPSPKACASMVCYQNQLIVFGGWRHPSEYPPYQPWRLFDELHVYNIKDNSWTKVKPMDGPPPMTGHSASIHRNVMIVFGGYQRYENGVANSNDLWCLDLATFRWYKPEVSDVKPQPRYGQFQIHLDDNHLLVLGGCGGPNNVFSDAWLLNMRENVWRWKSVVIKNKRWTASQMWCNPACRVGTKLVVLGPTAAMPSDCQYGRNHIVFNNRMPPQQQPQREMRPLHDINVPDADGADAHRRMPIEERNRPLLAENNANAMAIGNGVEANAGDNADPSFEQKGIDDLLERMRSLQRLRRNLQLGFREENDFWPQRFNEGSHERFRMAAFNVDNDNRLANRRDIRSARRIRLENIGREMQRRNNEDNRRDIRDGAAPVFDQAIPAVAAAIGVAEYEHPIPKRIKRNCIALFVCDIENVLTPTDTGEPTLDWMEYKNYGIVPGAPERLIHSSLVAGNGELILFGGLRKESQTNTSPTIQVSNSIHFLTFPRNVF